MATGIPLTRQKQNEERSNINITTTSEVSMLFDQNDENTNHDEELKLSPKRSVSLKINQLKNKRQQDLHIQQMSPIKSTFTE